MPGRLPRTARIRRRGEFTGVFDRGVKRHGRLMTVVVLPGAGAHHARLGIAASRKIGGAVERNLAKRRLREAFRLGARPAADVVVIPKRDLLTAPFEAVCRELATLVDGAVRHGRRTQADAPTPRRPRRDLLV